MVEESGCGTAIGQGLPQGCFHQGGFQGRAGSPAHDFSAVKVHHGGQVEPALGRQEVSDVGDPDAIGGLGFWGRRQQIGGDGMGMIGVGGFGLEGPFLAGLELERAHMAGHAVATARDACLLQTSAQTRTAVNFTVGDKETREFFPQLLVVGGALAGAPVQPRIVRTARHPQDLADILDGIVLGHKLDQGIPLGGRSDSMPIAFFRIS